MSNESSDDENANRTDSKSRPLAQINSPYKVLGDLSDSNGGIGVLGRNTATTGTTKGIEGRVDSSDGYGLATPDDAKIDGTAELGSLGGNLTGNKTITDLVGPGLTVSNGSLDASGSKPSVSDDGSAVLSAPDDVNFASNLSVSDDTDGTVSVDATDTGEANDGRNEGNGEGIYIDKSGTTLVFKSLVGGSNVTLNPSVAEISIDASDTHTAVSDTGTTVYSDVDDINFGTDISVTNDGGNAVTANLASDSVSVFAGNRLSGGGTVSLGSSTSIGVQPIGVEVYISGQNYGDTDKGKWIDVLFDTEVQDDGNGFDVNTNEYLVPISGDYQIDLNLNWSSLNGTLLEARVRGEIAAEEEENVTTLMYTKTHTSGSDESIEMSKVVKEITEDDKLWVEVRHDKTGDIDGGDRHLSTLSINKIA